MRQYPLHTRAGRAQASLRLPEPILERLSRLRPLHHALNPFRCKLADPPSVTAFIHSFGCCGPSERDWRALFASAGALRPEDLAVVIAYVACPNNLQDVVFGSPGILDHVCRLWDQWLLDEIIRVTPQLVQAEATQWALANSENGPIWNNGHAHASMSRCSLTNSVHTVALRIVKQVMKSLVDSVLERVSLGGQEQFMKLLAERGNLVVDTALGRAKTLLVERVFECGQRNCFTA